MSPPGGRMTVWRHEAMVNLSRGLLPIMGEMLAREPSLASAADVQGQGTLHHAAKLGMPSLTRLLLRSGASPTALSRAGRSPLDEAMHTGAHEVVELILGALDGEARKRAAKRVSEYASPPGAAIPPGIAATITGEPVLRRAPRLDAPPAQPTTARCEEGGGWDVDAPPTDKERRECATEIRARSVGEAWHPHHRSRPICGVRRCDIDQRSRLTADEYKREYYDRGRAVLIRDVMSLEQRSLPPLP